MTASPCTPPFADRVSAGSAPDTGRIILHVDMDSFYASVEMQRRPELRGKPVVVGADPKGGHGRGVACTCSYEARAYGIRSAMPVSRAYTLCPHAVFLPPDFDHYASVSRSIMELLATFGFRVCPVSIDEAYLDITPCGSSDKAAEIARDIQESIRLRTGLTCSVGAGPGTGVAKIASDYRKPSGLTIVDRQSARSFLAPLPVRKIPGVGKRAEQALLELGIRTIGELASADVQVLIGRFGRGAVTLHQLAQGIDERDLPGYDSAKSVSRETTFETDTDDPAVLAATLDTLVSSVCSTLEGDQIRCRTVTVKVRYQGFITRTKSRSLSHYTREPGPVRAAASALLREMADGRKVRLIGLRLSALEEPDRTQMVLGV